jgi:hypothetical protein
MVAVNLTYTADGNSGGGNARTIMTRLSSGWKELSVGSTGFHSDPSYSQDVHSFDVIIYRSLLSCILLRVFTSLAMVLPVVPTKSPLGY